MTLSMRPERRIVGEGYVAKVGRLVYRALLYSIYYVWQWADL
jgi:hypothetical protein